MKDISKSNGLRHESSCQSDWGDEEKGIVNKMQTGEATWQRSGSGREAGTGLACFAAFPGTIPQNGVETGGRTICVSGCSCAVNRIGYLIKKNKIAF